MVKLKCFLFISNTHIHLFRFQLEMKRPSQWLNYILHLGVTTTILIGQVLFTIIEHRSANLCRCLKREIVVWWFWVSSLFMFSILKLPRAERSQASRKSNVVSVPVMISDQRFQLGVETWSRHPRWLFSQHLSFYLIKSGSCLVSMLEILNNQQFQPETHQVLLRTLNGLS